MIKDISQVAGLDLGVIGNCRTAALLDTAGRIVWWCFPRFDADPVFSRLLAGKEEKGFCEVALDGAVSAEACYLRNTAIIETIRTKISIAMAALFGSTTRVMSKGSGAT